MLMAWEPLEPAREVPVPVAEKLYRRRQEYGADDGGVDQYGGGEPDPDCLRKSIESVAKIANTPPMTIAALMTTPDARR